MAGKIGSLHGHRPAIIKDDVALIPIGKEAKHGYAIVDKEFAWLDKYNWTLKSGYGSNYAVRRYDHKIVKMQWYVLPRKAGFVIDHINGDKRDNRITNLRYATHKENLRNRGAPTNNTSGYKGVSYRKDTDKYAAYIGHGKERICLGCFLTAREASLAYNKTASQIYGEFARLN